MAKKNPYPIPSQFDLGGITWKVEEVGILLGAMGATDPNKFKIYLLEELPPEVKFQVFLHEFVHAVLYTMGKHVEPHDEQFVDGFATLFLQYLKSAK